MSQSRQYDLVIFGASGYTGKLTAEHIVTHLPTDLKWALAGRSASKLEAVAADCKGINPDRIPPGIEVCNLNDEDLGTLAKKTRLLISTVGPYALYGEHAFKACAENGTHYLDVTGEVPYVKEMIEKYSKTAQANGCIMIPQIGIESAPSDLVTWSLVGMIKERFDAPTANVTVSLHHIHAAPSGGTLATVLNLMDSYSIKQLQAAHKPYSITPIPPPESRSPAKTLTTKLLGVVTVPDLGILTTSLAAVANVPIVNRSWGLLNGSYGPNFTYREYMRSRNYFSAVVLHLGLAMSSFFLAIPFVRAVVRRWLYKPGEGPTQEEYKNDRIEYRGVGTPDVRMPNPPRAFVRAHYEGSMYLLTGALLGEAAMTILRDEHDLPGDIYTPACLGQKFIDRLQDVGFKLEKKFLD